MVALAATFALGAAGFLLLMGALDLLPPVTEIGKEQGALAALGIISAALYATGLALGAESLARTSFWLLYAEEDRYRLLARNMTDVITRHGRNGAVLFVSPAAESLFGAKVADLLGHGLFDRVHVADRPAYLTALADAATLAEDRSVGVPRPARCRRSRARDGDAIHLDRDALPAARPPAKARMPRTARWSRSCATPPSARRSSRRSKPRVPRRSARTPPRATSSPP